MIGCGKYREVYLYEITEQDLLLEHRAGGAYRVGNVLLFANKRSIGLGKELVRADDLMAAKEYLDQRSGQNTPPPDEHEERLASLSLQLSQQEGAQQKLMEQIAQRDELLRDLSETLTSLRQDNELLHVQLLKAREKLNDDELKRDELVGDLQNASNETQQIESTLERVMEEKYQLEHELAERITELLELDLQNDDLRKQLVGPGQAAAGAAAGGVQQPQETAPPGAQQPQGTLQPPPDGPEQDGRILTMASGKQIHIMHEFPTLPKQGFFARASHMLLTATRIAAILVVAVLVLATASIFATAQVNGISFGAALDLILSSLGL